VVGSNESVKLRLDGQEGDNVPMKQLAQRVSQAQQGDANTPVVISADRNVKYEVVVKVMDTLQRAGIQRVGLSVKTGAASSN
jgi:biopolymer transport protein TolR